MVDTLGRGNEECDLAVAGMEIREEHIAQGMVFTYPTLLGGEEAGRGQRWPGCGRRSIVCFSSCFLGSASFALPLTCGRNVQAVRPQHVQADAPQAFCTPAAHPRQGHPCTRCRLQDSGQGGRAGAQPLGLP